MNLFPVDLSPELKLLQYLNTLNNKYEYIFLKKEFPNKDIITINRMNVDSIGYITVECTGYWIWAKGVGIHYNAKSISELIRFMELLFYFNDDWVKTFYLS